MERLTKVDNMKEQILTLISLKSYNFVKNICLIELLNRSK